MLGIPLGLAMVSVALIVSFKNLAPVAVRVLLGFSGIAIYIWGCLALARAKGYSSALVLTVVLGVLFPAVVLLALPDKHKDYRR